MVVDPQFIATYHYAFHERLQRAPRHGDFADAHALTQRDQYCSRPSRRPYTCSGQRIASRPNLARVITTHLQKMVPWNRHGRLRPSSRRAQPSCLTAQTMRSDWMRFSGFLVGHDLIKLVRPNTSPGWRRGLFGSRSAKSHSSNQVLPQRLNACFASRLDHRPAFAIPAPSSASQVTAIRVTIAPPIQL